MDNMLFYGNLTGKNILSEKNIIVSTVKIRTVFILKKRILFFVHRNVDVRYFCVPKTFMGVSSAGRDTWHGTE